MIFGSHGLPPPDNIQLREANGLVQEPLSVVDQFCPDKPEPREVLIASNHCTDEILRPEMQIGSGPGSN